MWRGFFMANKIARNLQWSFGLVLGVTGCAKVVSFFGIERILYLNDPILGIPFRYLLLLVGILEILIAGVCVLSNKPKLSSLLVAFLATNFAIYRLALWFMGWHRPCNCMGNLADAMHIPPQTADAAMKIILAYLLIGSYATLFWFWKQKRATSIAAPPSMRAAKS
jgi:hypothetical protein